MHAEGGYDTTDEEAGQDSGEGGSDGGRSDGEECICYPKPGDVCVCGVAAIPPEVVAAQLKLAPWVPHNPEHRAVRGRHFRLPGGAGLLGGNTASIVGAVLPGRLRNPPPRQSITHSTHGNLRLLQSYANPAILQSWNPEMSLSPWQALLERGSWVRTRILWSATRSCSRRPSSVF